MGSKNPVKVRAAEKVFSSIFPESEVRGIDVRIRTPKQPLGLRQTVEGAVRRARHAISVERSAAYGVGIEAGLVRVPHTITGWLDLQFTAVIDAAGIVTLGCGPGFEHPPQIVRSVTRGRLEVEEAMEGFTGIKDIGEREGAVGFLSRGTVNREDITVESIIMALLPRLNQALYHLRATV